MINKFALRRDDGSVFIGFATWNGQRWIFPINDILSFMND